MKKSKRLTNRELIGKKILGKYIFFRILALLTTLLEVVVTALPVSYTHLDVYKRQLHYRKDSIASPLRVQIMDMVY